MNRLISRISVRKKEPEVNNVYHPPRRDPLGRRRSNPPTTEHSDKRSRRVDPTKSLFIDIKESPEEYPKSSSNDRTKIIIGLDFGTTYSGAAYAIQHPDDDPDKTNISVVRNWPVKLAGDTSSSKVPTIISYEPNGKIRWGFDALHSDKGQNQKYQWMKLLLEPELNMKPSEVIDLQEIKALLKVNKKRPVQVASDYLKCLWEHVVSQICEDYGRTTFDFARKSIVLTVPAVWTPAARHNTFLVAAGAGLVSDDYDLQIISEPEAAAAAILKDRVNDVKPDDCYIVCDCGGGTVDLSSYWIKTTKPLCFSERVVSDGDTCGAVVLDMNFKRLLRTTLKGDTFDNLPPQNVIRIMNDFEAGIRKTFDGTDGRTYTIALPGVPDDAETGPQAGIMTLSPTILHPVFDPIMNKVERLVRKQINSLQKKGHSPKALFLVGGFGDNHYMKLRLKERFETRRSTSTSTPDGQSQEGIEVLSPSLGGWESIANGAVQCELLGIKNLISVRIARYNFGIACNQPFDPSRHRLEDKYICSYRHVERANNQVNWCLRRGDEITPGRAVRFRFNDVILPKDLSPTTQTVRIQAKIVRSEDDEAPSHHTPAVHHFVSITISWSKSELEKLPLLRNKSGTSFWYPKYEIVMVAGPAKLDFWSEIEGVRKGEVCGVRFNEGFGDDSISEGVGEVPAVRGGVVELA